MPVIKNVKISAVLTSGPVSSEEIEVITVQVLKKDDAEPAPTGTLTNDELNKLGKL